MNQRDYFGKTLKPWPIFVDHFNFIEMTDGVDRKDEFPLNLIDRAYRQAMDEIAKNKGLLFAANHDHYKNDPHEYNHALAVETMKGYESE